MPYKVSRHLLHEEWDFYSYGRWSVSGRLFIRHREDGPCFYGKETKRASWQIKTYNRTFARDHY
jgi:hypothetical protein